jgi:hypothetical protein
MEMTKICAPGLVAYVASAVLSLNCWGSGVAVAGAPELLWPEGGAAVAHVAADAALAVAAADHLRPSLEDSAY